MEQRSSPHHPRAFSHRKEWLVEMCGASEEHRVAQIRHGGRRPEAQLPGLLHFLHPLIAVAIVLTPVSFFRLSSFFYSLSTLDSDFRQWFADGASRSEGVVHRSCVGRRA